MMKCAVKVLAMCVLVHGNVVLPTRLVHAVPIGVSVAGLSLANVYRTYTREEQRRDVFEKDTRIACAALLGLGATGFVTKKLHGRLPTTRLARAVATCEKSRVDRRLLLNTQRPLSADASGIVDGHMKQYYLRYSNPLMECFNDLVDTDNVFSETKKELDRAQDDFGQDGNIEEQAKCKAIMAEIDTRKKDVDFLLHFVKGRPKFDAQAARYEQLQEAKKQSAAAEEAADSTSTIATAAVVHTVLSAGKR